MRSGLLMVLGCAAIQLQGCCRVPPESLAGHPRYAGVVGEVLRTDGHVFLVDYPAMPRSHWRRLGYGEPRTLAVQPNSDGPEDGPNMGTTFVWLPPGTELTVQDVIFATYTGVPPDGRCAGSSPRYLVRLTDPRDGTTVLAEPRAEVLGLPSERFPFNDPDRIPPGPLGPVWEHIDSELALQRMATPGE